MAHESFEDDETAALMNEWFVCVKVDREERPDVDAIYMEATQAMTGHGGWPMTVFATPDGAPFFCGTYFPDEPRGGQPSFRQLLAAVHEAWTERREELLDQSKRVADAIRGAALPTGTELPDAAVLDEAASAMLAAFDDQAAFARLVGRLLEDLELTEGEPPADLDTIVRFSGLRLAGVDHRVTQAPGQDLLPVAV
jgi:uncharacterized protein YyaL (SSP411 family)